MVDVQQSALRTFEQNGLAALEGEVELQARVRDAVLETLGLRQYLFDDLLRVECLAVVDLDQHLVLEFECCFDLLGQDLLVKDVRGTDTDTGDLVLVARADTAAGRADLLRSQEAFGDLVDGHVVRHDQVRISRKQQAGRVHAALFQACQFGQQHTRVDDDTVTDDVVDGGGEDSGRDEVQCELVTVRQNHGVSGVVTALVSHDPLKLLAQ